MVVIDVRIGSRRRGKTEGNGREDGFCIGQVYSSLINFALRARHFRSEVPGFEAMRA